MTSVTNEVIKNIYMKAAAMHASAGRLTASGRQYVEDIDQIFEATGLPEIGFIETVDTIAEARLGAEVTEDDRERITSSLRSFLKTDGSPFDYVKVGKFSVIRRKG